MEGMGVERASLTKLRWELRGVVEGGGRVMVTRHGKEVVCLVSPEEGWVLEQLEATGKLAELRAAVRKG